MIDNIVDRKEPTMANFKIDHEAWNCYRHSVLGKKTVEEAALEASEFFHQPGAWLVTDESGRTFKVDVQQVCQWQIQGSTVEVQSE